MSRLRIEELTSHSLAPVNLTINPGESVCLSGPSGSGKSTLLRAIADLDPHTGTAYLDDTECQSVDAPRWRRLVGLLPPESQWWYDRVRDHFATMDDEWLEQLGLNRKILDCRITRLSTGERQRLAILRLLMNQPKVLLLDEPTASLDAKSVRRVENLIHAYQQRHRVPILWVSHDPLQIRRIAIRRCRIQNGQLVDTNRK